jgi:cytochrome c
MKKTFIIFGLSLVIAACGNGKSDNSSGADSTASAKKDSSSAPAAATGTSSAPGAQLIAKADCGTCHKEQEKLIGPAFVDVAKKYTSSPAVIDTLANKIIKGGSGNWGTIPMGPHASLSMDDARTMVQYILSVKK